MSKYQVTTSGQSSPQITQENNKTNKNRSYKFTGFDKGEIVEKIPQIK